MTKVNGWFDEGPKTNSKVPKVKYPNRALIGFGKRWEQYPKVEQVYAPLFGELLDAGEVTWDKVKKGDVLILQGGRDINSKLYGETPHFSNQEPYHMRDFYEIGAVNLARKIGVHILGICRGAQLLTVMNGGKLIQDCNGHNKSHRGEVTFASGGLSVGDKIWVTSSHHQMMYPFDLKPKDYTIMMKAETGTGKDFHGSHHTKNIDLPKNFVEPETVMYHGKYGKELAIQGHPEYLMAKDYDFMWDSPFIKYCHALIDDLIS